MVKKTIKRNTETVNTKPMTTTEDEEEIIEETVTPVSKKRSYKKPTVIKKPPVEIDEDDADEDDNDEYIIDDNDTIDYDENNNFEEDDNTEDEGVEEEGEEPEEEIIPPTPKKKNTSKATKTTKKPTKKVEAPVEKPSKKKSTKTEEKEEEEEEVSSIPAFDLNAPRTFHESLDEKPEFKKSRISDSKRYLNELVTLLENSECEQLSTIFESDYNDSEKRAVASWIVAAVEEAQYKLLCTGIGVPLFGNARMVADPKPCTLYKAFGERMSTDILKLPHAKIKVLGCAEIAQSTGELLDYVPDRQQVSYLSTPGISDDNDTFTATSDTKFVKNGDILDIETGDIVAKNPTKKTSTRKKK